jgi:putative flippase GtrA
VVCTGAFAVFYAALREFTGALEANAGAMSLTIAINFLANRHLTFRHADGSLAIQALQYLFVYLVGLGASTLVLHGALQAVGQPSRGLETLLAVASGLAATVIRYLLLSWWVFRGPRAQPDALETASS